MRIMLSPALKCSLLLGTFSEYGIKRGWRLLVVAVGGVDGWVRAGRDFPPMLVGPQPRFRMGPDALAHHIHDLLRERRDDFFLIRCFIEGRRRNDLTRVRFIDAPLGGLTEREDDVGASAVGEVRGRGGDRRGHAEEVDPDAALFLRRVLIQHECGFAAVAEAADQGAHRPLAGNDGHAGLFAEFVQQLVDLV